MKKLLVTVVAITILFAGVAGAQVTNVIEIRTAEDITATWNNLDAHYVLVNDIDLRGKDVIAGAGISFPFSGTFDGQGYTITTDKAFIDVVGENGVVKNVNIVLESGVGVANINEGTIKNINVEMNAIIDDTVDMIKRSVVGIADTNKGVITDVNVSGRMLLDANQSRGAGVVFNNSGTIKNVVVDATNFTANFESTKKEEEVMSPFEGVPWAREHTKITKRTFLAGIADTNSQNGVIKDVKVTGTFEKRGSKHNANASVVLTNEGTVTLNQMQDTKQGYAVRNNFAIVNLSETNKADVADLVAININYAKVNFVAEGAEVTANSIVENNIQLQLDEAYRIVNLAKMFFSIDYQVKEDNSVYVSDAGYLKVLADHDKKLITIVRVK